MGEKGVCPGLPRGPQNKEDALLPLHPPSSLWEDPERLLGPSLGPSYEEQTIPAQAPRLGAVGMERLDPLPPALALGLTVDWRGRGQMGGPQRCQPVPLR